MKASISIVVRKDAVQIGDKIPVFVHLHVFKPIKFRNFTLRLVCEDVTPTSMSTEYMRPPTLLFLYNDSEAFHEIMPGRVIRFEKEIQLEGEGSLEPDAEKNYEVEFQLPDDESLTTVITDDFYRHWYFKATIDKPHAFDIHQLHAINVLPKED